jgi:cysteine-rich repeat protein
MNWQRNFIAIARISTACAIAVLLVAAAYQIAIWRVRALEIPTTIKVSICGNGTIEDELCDDGSVNNIGGYASSTTGRICNPDCQSFGPYCGDGILQVRFTEECDDGNNTSGDLCSATCIEEDPVQPRATGAPPRGPIPPLPIAPGAIPSEILTKVVLRGKAYPNSTVNILLDGKLFGTVQTDTNADFLYTTTSITPGTATFSFNAKDRYGTASITTTSVFDVVQSAVTTVANIFLPPTITATPNQAKSGDSILLSGQSVPLSTIATVLSFASSTMGSEVEPNGDWALMLDTSDLEDGAYTAKSSFELPGSTRSGYGKSVSFYIGIEAPAGCGSPDMNDDGKVNLVDFSIFLISWNTTEPRADFNCDGKVNLADFSIMLFGWTG